MFQGGAVAAEDMCWLWGCRTVIISWLLGGVGRLTEWQNTGMTQKPLASLEQILRQPVSCRSSTPPAGGGRNEQSSSRSTTVTSGVGSSGSAEGSDAGAEAGFDDAAQRPSKRGLPETPAIADGARRDARLPGSG